MSEIADAVQVIRVGIDTLEVFIRVGAGGLSVVKNIATFFYTALHREKIMGETKLRDLLLKGGNLQVFQFDETEMKQFEKLAKRYGILYSKLVDVNEGDGLKEVLFHPEAVPRMNMLIQKMRSGKIVGLDEYISNLKPEEYDQLIKKMQKDIAEGKLDELTQNAAKNKQEEYVSKDVLEKVGLELIEEKGITADTIKEKFGYDDEFSNRVLTELETAGIIEKDGESFRGMLNPEMFQEKLKEEVFKEAEAAEQIENAAAMKRGDFINITIAKKMYVETKDGKVKTRIPGEKNQFIWLDEKNIQMIHDGKTMLTYLKKDEEYEIVDQDDKVVDKAKGQDIYDKHYDPVNPKMADSYKKKDQTQKQTQVKTHDTKTSR